MFADYNAMLKVVFGETSLLGPVPVPTSCWNLAMRFSRAFPTILSSVSRTRDGKTGPGSGHGVNELAEENSSKNSTKD